MRPALDYLFAVTVTAVAVLLRALLDPTLGDAFPLVTLFGAVAMVVMVSGIRPAVLATLAGYVACSYMFIPPRGTLAFTPASGVGLSAYVFTCALIILAGEAARRSRIRANDRGEVLRVTLASIGDAVITTDTKGRITYLNSVAERLTGWSIPEVTGQPIDRVFRIIDEETRGPVASPAMRALREGAAVGLANHTILVRKDGTELAIDDSAAPIKDEQGQVSGCVLIFRDVTERRRLERDATERLTAANLLASIVESSDDAIVRKALDGTIETWNAGAERLFGYSADEAVGRHISLVIPPDRLPEEDTIIEALKAGRRIDHYETQRVRKTGERVTVSLTISPIRDAHGAVVGASKIARDVTERRRLEDHLRRLAADLAEQDRKKSEFLATLAHELRNPLAPLLSAVELLQQTGQDPDRARMAIETMDRQLGQLIRLVDDLIDVNRVTYNRLELRLASVDLASVIRHAVEMSRPLADRAGHRLQISLPEETLHLQGDAVRLTQVFANLLNNSCKYTPPGGDIQIAARHEGPDVVVVVSDTGAGIPPERLDTIFDMFSQGDRSPEYAQGGLGIGLALVRRLVAMHGGSVTVRSEGPGKGSEFTVRLPVAAAPQTVTGPEAAPADALPPRRVLVVDDNRDAAEAMAMLLRQRGHEAFIEHDGHGAVVAAEKHRPDVILLDIGLPGLSGYDVCRRIREQSWGRDVRIVALTGWGQEDDRRKSREAGFDGHLVKPVDLAALLEQFRGEAQTR